MAQGPKRSEELKRFLHLAGVRPAGEEAHHQHSSPEAAAMADEPGCTVRELPERLKIDAAGVAAAVNPVNVPQGLHELALAVPQEPARLTLAVGKYFGSAARTLTVSFLETTLANLRDRIMAHLNAWNQCCGISFRHTTGVGQIRISRAGSGYWSYLGTDVLLIPSDRPTMNLQGFSMATPESEYFRVVRHEAGHTLGFPHEHMRKELVGRIDPQKAYDYFRRTNNWDKAMVDAQVLTPLADSTIRGTAAADQTSIMCYHLPGAITKDGQPILGGLDINPTDCAFARSVYPKAAPPRSRRRRAQEDARPSASTAGQEKHVERAERKYEDIPSDWSPQEDVDVEVLIEGLKAESGPPG